MYDHMLYEMAKAVSDKCNIRMDAAMNALICYWQDKIACPWDMDDMLTAAQRAGKPITCTDAVKLLKQIFDNYDPDLGISRQTLDVALEDYHLCFDSLPMDVYPDVYGVFSVWRASQPIAHQFGLFPDKGNGNLPEALAFAKTLAQEAPGTAVFVGCELPEGNCEAQPWLVVLFANEQFSITETESQPNDYTQGVTHV